MNESNPRKAARSFDLGVLRGELSFAMLAYAATLGYLALGFDLGASEAIRLSGGLALCVIVVAGVQRDRRGRRLAPIGRFLGRESGDVSNEEANADAKLAFREIVSLPVHMQQGSLVVGLASFLIVPPLMWMMGFEAWLGLERLRSLATISLVGSLVSGLLLFHWAKNRFSSLRIVLASAAGDAATRANLVTRTSLRRKLWIAVTLPVFASVLLVFDVVNLGTGAANADHAARWAMNAVEALADGDSGQPITERIADRLPQEKFWPMPLEVVELGSDRLAARPVNGVSDSFLSALTAKIERGERMGLIAPPVGPEIGAFRVLGNGRILISKVQHSDFDSAFGWLDWAVGIVSLLMLFFAAGMGRLASSDVVDGLETLEVAVDKMLGGDLAERVVFESEDEIGALGRGLDLVGGMLRDTIARFATAAEKAEGTAAGASVALAELVSTAASQTQQIRRVSEAIETMNTQVAQASRSATSLNATIEESGSSLLELGATGDELNQTAAVLTSKVDAVSDSLEQMVGSVKQVAGTTERLSAASEETSSSMEEMASAMRAIDTSAETTANLSREVVAKAELGQAKVVQTIEGMEAIREATDAAENVIRGLGARTKAIGGILDVIDDVADETNLLALNAAIIAAQAGEQGKAFSVVADEIKELADRVLASTKEIGSLIRAVQDESENAIGAIEAGSASVMSGVDLSAEAGRTLEEITVASRESGTRIAEIVASVREQTRAASHVAALMERVRDSAEEIGAAGAEQDQGNEVVYQSALAMRDVAQQVRRTTEEQARGFGRIRENVVGVREAVVKITGSLEEQSGACRQVTESLGIVSKGNRSNEAAAEKLREAMGELISQAESLREGAERFRV